MKPTSASRKKRILFICGVIGLVAVFCIGRTVFFSRLDAMITHLVRKSSVSGFAFKTKEECEKNNGDWERAGVFPTEFCRIPLSDAGKPCFAGFQCQAGVCLALHQPNNQPLFQLGTCPKYTVTFGCTKEVHFGIPGVFVCRD